jgi:hypothetical protein
MHFDLGEQWPRIQEMPKNIRLGNIPTFWAGNKKIIANAFPGASTTTEQKPNE